MPSSGSERAIEREDDPKDPKRSWTRHGLVFVAGKGDEAGHWEDRRGRVVPGLAPKEIAPIQPPQPFHSPCLLKNLPAPRSRSARPDLD